MANPNTAFGLKPVSNLNGAPWTGRGSLYFVPSSVASNLFVGDPVVPLTNAADANGIPAVTLATAGSSNNVLGSVVGIVPGGDPVIAVTRDLPVYHQASTAAYILVEDDPNVIYEIQEDSVGGALVQGAPGRNANLVSGTGSTVTGFSGWQLQSSSLATTNTLQLRILRLVQRVDSAVGVNAKWLVRINLHSITSQTGV